MAQDDTESVRIGIDKKALLSILKRAASRERTVVEFRTTEKSGEKVLDTAMDISDHVEALEEEQNREL